MSDERTLRQVQALERFWDRLVRGESTGAADLDPGMEAFARRVHALDTQPEPDPVYRRQLWEDLMNAPSSADRMTLPAPIPFGPNGRTIPGRRGLAAPAIPSSGWQRTHVYIATAMLIAAVLALIFFYVVENRQATPPPGPASPVTAPIGDHSWPMYGGSPGRTRSLAGTGPVGEPVTLWTYSSAGSNDPRAVVDRGAVGESALFLPTNDGSILALDRATGAVLWRAEGYWDVAVIDGDGLIVHATGTGANGTLARIRQSDGSLVWSAEDNSIAGNSNPVVADGVGFTPSGGDFIAFDPANGATIWRTALQAPASRGASVADGLAVLGDEQGTIYGIATADGSIRWTLDSDAATIGHPVIANGVAYFTLIGGAEEAYLALDATTGTEKWRFVIPDGLGFNNGALGESMIYVPGQDGTIYALDLATGTPIWTFSTGSLPVNSPTLAGGVLYLTAGSGYLYALDPATGAEQWRFQLDAGGNGNLPVVDGVVYAGTEGNTVYAIGGSESSGFVPSPIASPAASPASEASPEASPVTFRWATRGGAETLSTPLAVAVAPDGTIWVADIPGKFLLFDEDGNYLETWGTPGSGPGQFNFNGNYIGAYIAFAPDGSFYVSDMNNRRVEHFDKDRNLVGEIEGDGTEAGRFGAPGGIAILSDGTLLIPDSERNVILHFEADGTFLDQFDAAGTTDGPLVSPVGIAVDSQGRLVDSEIALGRARVFDKDGNQLAVLDATGLEPPFFNNSAWLGIDPYDNIYICDQNNGLIRVFGPNLEFAFQFGRTGEDEEMLASPGWIGFGPDGAIYVSDDVGILRRFDLNNRAATDGQSSDATAVNDTPAPPAFVWATRGGDQPRVAQPLDVAVAPDGKVWVADTPGRFHIFDSDGTYLETWGTPGSGPGQFRFTGSVGTGTFFTFAPDGSLYVADIFNHRIQRFGPDREYLGEWQSAFGAPDLWPAGIAFEPDGTLMVAGAPFANDIQWFTPDGTFIERWDASGTTDGPLGGPSDVARDPQGRLIVVEGDPARVRVFDQDRNQIAALDLSGQQPPAWSVPGDVEVDAAGNIYVSDGLNGLVRVFGPDLMFAYQWGQNGEGQAVMTHPDWLGLGPSGEIYVSDGVGLLRRFDLPTDDRDKPSASPAP